MDKHLLVSLEDHNDKQSLLVEIDNAEKQLWALILTKGLLHSDVENLRRKIRFSYEKIIINCNELEDLQDIEYSLWKLHYKHIDEFRKRTKISYTDAGNSGFVQGSIDNHIEGFKSFLSQASQYYQSLILKVKRCYGLSEEIVLFKKGGMHTTVAPETLHRCQFLCHRFFVCLGDLARYKELYGKPDVGNHNWSVAAAHYLEATMIWPDSGNPHNQLAVLATYVGDEFLALYHCIRSLAVKEPFPDAWNNLILLLEKNRSSDWHPHSSERTTIQTKPQSSGDFGNSSMHNSPTETNLWSLFIRTISFFFTKPSLDDFHCALSSMMKELDALMTLNETNLEAALESYQCMCSARKGPFRTLQVVSVFIFLIQNLVNNQEQKDMEPERQAQLALMVIFTFMGRLVDRCLKASPPNCSPLLPAILVFVEWLVGMLDKAEMHGTDGKSIGAMSYFFSALSDFLNQINISEVEVKFAENIPLWEDYELRGYAPAAGMHELLDFSTQCLNYASGNESRTWRIVNAALKIANRINNFEKWIGYDESRRKFFVPEMNGHVDKEKIELSSFGLEVNEPHLHAFQCTKKSENEIIGESHCVNGRLISMEEEEVILFEPLRRYNSVPLSTSKSTGGIHCKDPNLKCNKPLKQQEPSVNNAFSEASMPISAGPPSLSAWVINRGNLGMDKSDIFRPGLNAVEEEVISTSLTGLSTSENGTIADVTSHYYSAPVPSAPLLPDDAVWLSGTPSNYREASVGGISNPYGALQVSGYPYGTAIPGPMDALCGMTSSEWLRQYREHHNREQGSNHMRLQGHGYALGELHNHDASSGRDPFLMAPHPSSVPFYGVNGREAIQWLRRRKGMDDNHNPHLKGNTF